METQSAFEKEDLERLLTRLDSDRTVAAQKYEDLRSKLIMFFKHNGCSLRDETLTDETVNRVAKKLKTEAIDKLDAYALKVARFVRLEDGKKYRRESSIEDVPGGTESITISGDEELEIVERMDQKVRADCLRKCRAKLSPEDDRLFIAYHSAEDGNQKAHRQQLATKERMTMMYLRIRIHRTRKILEKCVGKCLQEPRRSFAR